MEEKNDSTLKEENLVLPMSIEEALEIVKPLENPIFKGKKLFDAINTLANLAKWYKSQDFVRREDIKEKCHCVNFREEYCKNMEPCRECSDYGLMASEIDEISKVEPKIKHVITVDKETYDAIKNSEVPDHTKLIEEVRAQEKLIVKERKTRQETQK